MVSVVILGSGIAGVVAAYDLIRAGITNITVLEADDRYLGRMKKYNGPADFPIDLGGQWIQTNASILEEVINDSSVVNDLEYVPHDVNFTIYSTDFEEFFVTEDQFDPNLNLLWINNATWYDFFDKFIVPTSLDNILLNCAAWEVDSDVVKPQVRVRSTCGTFISDKVIVATPLPTLRDGDINFVPNLPLIHRISLDFATWFTGFKVFIEFKDQFYNDEIVTPLEITEVFGVLSGELQLFWDESHRENSTRHVLGFAAVGEAAEPFVSKADGAILSDVLDLLDSVYEGQATPNYIQGVVQNWEAERFIRGAYSDKFRPPLSPFSAEELVEQMTAPIDDRVFFAGEYIAPEVADIGYVHGAARSGRAAANRILEEAI